MALPFRNIARAIGSPDDPVATDSSSSWSWISLLKAVFQSISDGTLVAAATGRAESFVSLCQSAAGQTAHNMRLARASRIAAAASEANASASATSAEFSAAGVGFAAGTALFGQRAKKDRILAQTAATNAAASAASITSEGLVLGVQVFS